MNVGVEPVWSFARVKGRLSGHFALRLLRSVFVSGLSVLMNNWLSQVSAVTTVIFAERWFLKTVLSRTAWSLRETMKGMSWLDRGLGALMSSDDSPLPDSMSVGLCVFLLALGLISLLSPSPLPLGFSCSVNPINNKNVLWKLWTEMLRRAKATG